MPLVPALTRGLTRGLTRSLTRAVGGGGGGDEFFANVTLLLDWAGADQATDTEDLSASDHQPTFIGEAQVDTAQKFISVNSLLVDGSADSGAGSGDRVSFPNHANWDLGTGDFTWECGAFFLGRGTNALLSNRGTTVGAWLRYSHGTTVLQFLDTGSLLKAETWAPALSTWYHVAICRSGTNLRMFIDGIELGSATTNSTDIAQSDLGFSVGATNADTGLFNGNIGAVRLTKGVARYTANFTPPTEFYPTS